MSVFYAHLSAYAPFCPFFENVYIWLRRLSLISPGLVISSS